MGPSRLSQFRVDGELGAGSYSVVLRATLLETGEVFALKVQRKAFLLREGKAATAAHERAALAALVDVPGVLRFAFSFQDASALYLATELCAGGDLHGALAARPNRRAGAGEARHWGAQVASALAAVHAAGWLHRDVKPENVLLDGAGHVRLADFGSCAPLVAPPPAPEAAAGEGGRRRPRGCGSLVGTAEYCAPEVIQGSRATVAADWYALGCLLFTALAGAPAFHRPSEYLTMQAVLAGGAALPPEADAPPDAVAAVAALMAPAPDERPASLAALRSLPFFATAPWAELWTAPPPPLLPPPPPPEAPTEALQAALEAAAPPFTPPAPLPPAPLWVMQPGERVVRACAEVLRKRGVRTERGRLVLTSAGRVALLPLVSPLLPLLEAQAGRGAARVLDATHVGLQLANGTEALLELADAPGWAAVLTQED